MNDPTPTIVLASVWLAVVCMPAGILLRVDPARCVVWRGLWTLGAVSFLIHTATAYGLVYDWSQTIALEETRRQTAAATGFDSGAGLYLNLVFAALWTVDATRTWLRPRRTCGQITSVALVTHGFLTFMLFNGAFLFVAGGRRWLGLTVSILVFVLWGVALHRHRGRAENAR